ncbi:hypothetical protein Y032_0135g1941 [Ancylostoma ceylanicum]|uniref:Uncharacterized protein n=1 Tax=Ancylostoma ceylanicum TaxID=53326 RepID=A0A016T4V5_9BILA|nr:hypothetical protein Y032_0135g1941 [Ancylostoma ceylanicum]
MRNSLEKNDALIIRSSDLSRAPERFRCSNATKSNRENAYNQLRNKSAWPLFQNCHNVFLRDEIFRGCCL